MFKLVVVILCFATLLVSTGSALKKDEYEINIKHGSFAVHQRHVNEGTSRSVPAASTVAPGSASKENVAPRDEQFFGAADGAERPGGGSAVDGGVQNDLREGERISTTLPGPRPTEQSVDDGGDEVSGSVRDRKPIKSIDFNAVSPGLEEVPLQANIFQSSLGRGRSSSYQSVAYYGADEVTTERNAIVQPISSQDFYNTPQLQERGPVLFTSEPTTTTTPTTTTVKPPGKLFKSIPKSAVDENEEVYLLLKYEQPRKNPEEAATAGQQSGVEDGRQSQKTTESGRVRMPAQNVRSRSRGRPQAEQARPSDDFLQEGLRAGGSFTTVGYFVSDAETTTSMTPVSTTTKNTDAGNTVPTKSPGRNAQIRGSSNKLRNSYGDYLSADFKDFEDSIRPIEENVDETIEAEDETGDVEEEGGNSETPEDIDENLDAIEMTKILAGRQSGLSISEFNRLFKDYLKKEITVDDLDDFAKLENADKEPAKDLTTSKDPTKSFDIRAENGKKVLKTATGLPGPTLAQKQQLDQLKVLINKGSLRLGRKEKVVKIGYGGSKSFQGVYKSQKFLEKVKSERTPLSPDGSWGGSEYRQQQPVREIGPMAYVDNPVFGFVPGGRSRTGSNVGGNARMERKKSSNGVEQQVGQSYVKFQKIS